MTTKTAERTTSPFVGLDDAKGALIEGTKRAVPAEIPVGSPTACRKFLLAKIDELMEAERQAALAKAEDALRGNKSLENVLAACDYFKNSGGAPITVLNTPRGTRSIGKIIEDLGQQNKMIQVALAEDVDNESIALMCEEIAAGEEEGVKVNLFSTIEQQNYEDLMGRLNKESLLGDKPGRDALHVFSERVYDTNFDRNRAAVHTPVGALLGRRHYLDAVHGIAEPMAGIRDSGDGPKGLLKGLSIAPQPEKTTPFSKKQRRELTKQGINTLYAHGEYRCLVGGNRSLRDGCDTAYVFNSTTRLRQLVSAKFHETVEVEVLHDGRREAGPLEKVAGQMNAFIAELTAEGWLKSGAVTVDYSTFSNTLAV